MIKDTLKEKINQKVETVKYAAEKRASRPKPARRKRTMRERWQEWGIFIQDVRYNLGNADFRRKRAAFGKLLILLFIMIGIPVLLLIFARDTFLNPQYLGDLPERLAEHPRTSFLILILLQMAQIVVSVLPAEPVQFAASYLFGIGGGYVIALTGAILGSVVTYEIADFLGSDAIHLIFGKGRVQDYINKLNSTKALLIVFLIYLIPGIPKDLVSYIAGISDMRLIPVLVASTLGRTPGLFLGLALGSFWADRNYLGLALVIIAMGAIIYVSYKYKDKLLALVNRFEDIEQKHH